MHTFSERGREGARRLVAISGIALAVCICACKAQHPAPAPTPVPTVAPSPTPDTKRSEAIDALKAVESVVANEGTLEQFRKYQLEAAIKVDGLPDEPKNSDIKAVARLYKHANTLVGISLAKTVFGSQLEELKETYADIPEFVATLKKIDTTLAKKEVEVIGKTGLTRDLLAIDIEKGRAQNQFLALKAMGILTAKASPRVKALQ